MRNLLLAIATCICSTLYCQTNNNSKIYYSAQSIILKVKKDETTIAEKPYGSNVTIAYDTFFKSFEIRFTDEKNVKQVIFLYYVREYPDEIFRNIMGYYKDGWDSPYLIFNALPKGYLSFTAMEQIEGHDFTYIIDGIK